MTSAMVSSVWWTTLRIKGLCFTRSARKTRKQVLWRVYNRLLKSREAHLHARAYHSGWTLGSMPTHASETMRAFVRFARSAWEKRLMWRYDKDYISSRESRKRREEQIGRTIMTTKISRRLHCLHSQLAATPNVYILRIHTSDSACTFVRFARFAWGNKES